MNISFKADELLELVKLDWIKKQISNAIAETVKGVQPKAFKLDAISFKTGNIIDITATVSTTATGNLLSKVGSFLNNLSGRKNIKLTITAPQEDQLHIVLNRLGAKNFGPGNLLLSLFAKAVIRMTSAFSSNNVSKGIICRDNTIIIKLNNLLEPTGAEVKINTVELQDDNCYIDISLVNNTQPGN